MYFSEIWTVGALKFWLENSVVFCSDKVICSIETQHILINKTIKLAKCQSQILNNLKHTQQDFLRIKSVSVTVQTTRHLSIYRYTHLVNLTQFDKYTRIFPYPTVSKYLKKALIRAVRHAIHNLQLSLPQDGKNNLWHNYLNYNSSVWYTT
jgi:hypothetical protein